MTDGIPVLDRPLVSRDDFVAMLIDSDVSAPFSVYNVLGHLNAKKDANLFLEDVGDVEGAFVYVTLEVELNEDNVWCHAKIEYRGPHTQWKWYRHYEFQMMIPKNQNTPMATVEVHRDAFVLALHESLTHQIAEAEQQDDWMQWES